LEDFAGGCGRSSKNAVTDAGKNFGKPGGNPAFAAEKVEDGAVKLRNDWI
jgi:hypothetical protein